MLLFFKLISLSKKGSLYPQKTALPYSLHIRFSSKAVKANALNYSTQPHSAALRALALETVERVSAIRSLKAVN